MKMSNFYSFFNKFSQVRFNESLKRHTSFGVGGNAKVYIEPDSIGELFEILEICKVKKLRYKILGNGTNVYFSDKGFRGVVICLKRLNKIKVCENCVIAESGVSLFQLNKVACKNCLKGLEFTYGIPGSVGGAIIQNAGAFGGEIGDKICSVVVLRNGKIVNEKNFWFSYRNSCFKNSGDVILKVAFKLSYGDEKEIKSLQKKYLQKRLQTQPYDKKSAGSVFKRNGEIIPAKMIDTLGLKGVKIGDVEISPLHANFIVNHGEGTARDINKLVKFIKRKVKKSFGEKLEQEIEFIEG